MGILRPHRAHRAEQRRRRCDSPRAEKWDAAHSRAAPPEKSPRTRLTNSASGQTLEKRPTATNYAVALQGLSIRFTVRKWMLRLRWGPCGKALTPVWCVQRATENPVTGTKPASPRTLVPHTIGHSSQLSRGRRKQSQQRIEHAPGRAPYTIGAKVEEVNQVFLSSTTPQLRPVDRWVG